MPKALVIVESPAKAKTIAKFLGKDYDVLASFGHVRDLPQTAAEIPASVKKEKWARLGVDIAHDYEPLYIIPSDKKARIAALKKSLAKAQKVLLATDEDREGESISWHLLEVLKPKVPVQRIVFHEITKDAILAALKSPRDLDTQLVRAQEARRILDRLYGYSLSPVLWKKVQPKLSAGRVQSVAVRLLVLRERERMAFMSGVYWDVTATCAADGTEFPATLEQLDGKRIATGKDFDPETGKLKVKKALLLDRARAAAVADALEGKKLAVASVETTEVSKNPYPPFTTATLQQAANRTLGFTAKRTMQIAQQLYEGIDVGGDRTGLITYMRTDSVTLSKLAMAQAQEMIKKLFGAKATTGPRQYKTNAKGAQEAHEAIRPTDLRRTPESLAHVLDREQLRLYELVWKRTIASQMAAARLARTAATLTGETPEGVAAFVARGQRVIEPGYLAVYGSLEDRETMLPALKKNAKVPVRSLTAEEHATQPPARYTEASLVKKLEQEGIGRPSTYASIISTIQDRGYSQKIGNALVPTFTAFAVTELLEEHFAELVDLQFTAKMEEALDEIAEGKRDAIAELRAFYEGGGEGAGIAKRIESEQDKIEYPAIGVADGVVVKVGRFGAYLQDRAGNRATVPENVAPADLTDTVIRTLLSTGGSSGGNSLGADPKTGLEVTVRSGRFGPYVQLGPDTEDDGPKPKRATIRKPLTPETITLIDALALLAYPRELGKHPKLKEPVVADNGRYGPYVRCGKEFRSVVAPQDVATITLKEAVALLDAPKQSRFGNRGGSAREPLRKLGKDGDGNEIQVFAGRFGPYVTNGKKVYASLPKGATPETVALEDAIALIAAKAAKGPAKKFRRRRR